MILLDTLIDTETCPRCSKQLIDKGLTTQGYGQFSKWVKCLDCGHLTIIYDMDLEEIFYLKNWV